jgi:tetratricopeptide (TPR) repeat protein
MPRPWFAAVLLLSLPASPALAQAPLAWRFQQKDQFHVEWSTAINTEHKTSREKEWNKLAREAEKLTAVLRVTVLKSLPDGGAELELLAESVTGNPVQARVDPRVLLGQPVRATLDARMNVARLEGLEPICRKRFGEGAEPPSARLFRGEVEEICRGWLQDIFVALPGKAVGAGEKWEQETRRALAPMGHHVLRKTFTHEGKAAVAGRELTRVGVTATSTLIPAKEEEFNLPYRILRAEFEEAEYRGSLSFDLAAGRLVQAEFRLKTRLSALFAARGEAEGLEAKQEQTTTVRVVDRKPGAQAAVTAPAPPPPTTPADAPYRRLLTGQDALLAASLEKRIGELTEAGLWAEALKLARELAALRERVQGAGHWQAADAARNVRTLLKLVALPEPDRTTFLAVPRMLAEAAQLRARGKTTEGAVLCDKAWDIRTGVLGEEHESTVGVYDDLAAAESARGQHADAQVLGEKALEVARRALGEEHPDTARAYHNLGCHLLAQGKPADAEPHLRKAVEIRLRVLGEQSAATASSYSILAATLSGQARYAEAEPWLRKSLEVHTRVLGEAHVETARTCAQLGNLLRSLGREQEGQELLRRAGQLQRRAGGS